ncbi:putative Heterokaryon incompatibility domain-containing protein [Seiridium cardinale]|uniref:Heterokaryon incompatibility domain-containing protein n=1 Tax=Seiridium cardinale TaxID=138064 RepID=A0ABR2Y3S3_9PEZI
MAKTAGIDRALGWLNHCALHHPLCANTIPIPLPKRVLDVASRDEPFLLETNGDSGDYIALSYCWGLVRNVDMMTIGSNSKGRRGAPDPKPNIEKHKIQIAFVTMPKTIQDAVIVCRKLGIKYLWVDTFCIVQGDDEEWMAEHPRMATIYANAKLVIAASSAAASDSGFLNVNSEVLMPTAEVYLRDSCIRVTTNTCPRHGTKTTNHSHNLSPLLWDEPLNRRAWTLSEAIFSNRVLHFTSSEMVWECNHARIHETGCSWVFPNVPGDEDDTFRVFRSPTIAQRYTRGAMYRKWRSLIEHFSARQINSSPKQTDKDSLRLVALARLARRFSQMLESSFDLSDVYLSGIWKGDLVQSLLWSVERGAPLLLTKFYLPQHSSLGWRRPEPQRGPSWSWVSVEGPVYFESWLWFRQDFTVIDATVQHHDSREIFGQVKSGVLVAYGQVAHGLKIQSGISQAPGSLAGHCYRMRSHTADSSCVFICDVPLRSVSGGPEFSCLYLGHGVRENPSSDGDSTIHVFMLLRRINEKDGTFERIGISSLLTDGVETCHLLKCATKLRVMIV